MGNDTYSKLKKLSVQTDNTAITSPTPTRYGQIRGRSIKILALLEKESSRTVELGESMDYPPHYVWKYLNNLRKYGLVREQDYSWFLTDLGASFILKFLNKYTIVKTRKTLEREEKDSRKLEPIRVLKQVSLEEYSQIHNLDSVCSGVVEVLAANYRKTKRQGRFFNDDYEATEWINNQWQHDGVKLLTVSELGEALMILFNEGTCWDPGLKPGGKRKIGITKKCVLDLKLEPP